MRYLIVIGLLLMTAPACINHVDPYVPKKRQYEMPMPHHPGNGTLSDGSLFTDNSVGAIYQSDERAQFVNDVINIIIDERATAERDTSTQTKKDDSYETQLNEFMGFVKELEGRHPNFDGGTMLSAAHKAGFKGEGKTARNDRLQATVPAMVRTVLPNGGLFVEGHRVILVNSEENHFYISGVIRRIDIDQDNTVRSSRIADAQIEFTGRGNLTRGSEKGWFGNVLDYIWPF
ncbi:MAG: flagellar basal body L-ring protein FlgH [Myxococcales bacterium]|nr:flagellar basal body L-ring protein FlgH [Myxococcales bacterium]